MNHDAAREKLLDLACGELPGREAARVEAHAAGCEACRAELTELRETRRLMSGLGELPAPARGEAELLAAARAAVTSSSAGPRPWRLPAWFLGASAAVATLVTVTAVSYRLLAASPPRRDDPGALLGRGTVAEGGTQQPAVPEPLARKPATEAPAPAAATAGPPATAAQDDDARAAASRGDARGAASAAPSSQRRPAPRTSSGASAPAAAAAPPPPAALAAPPARKTSREAVPAPTAGERRVAMLHAPSQDEAHPARARASTPDPAPAPSTAPVGIAEAPAARRRAADVPERHAFAAPAHGPAADAAPAPAARAASPSAESSGARASASPAFPAEPPAEGAAAAVLARWSALRDAGRLGRQVVAFPGCSGEARREVETDPDGRVVRYVRHGSVGGVPFRAELYYAEDGTLGLVRYREAQGPWRELGQSSGPGTAGSIPAAALEPRRAADARADAPPRCRI